MKGNHTYIIFVLLVIFLGFMFSGGWSTHGTGTGGPTPTPAPLNPAFEISYTISPCPDDEIQGTATITQQTATITLQADEVGYSEIKVLLNGLYKTVKTDQFTPPQQSITVPFTQATGIGYAPWRILFYNGAVGSGILQNFKNVDKSDCF